MAKRSPFVGFCGVALGRSSRESPSIHLLFLDAPTSALMDPMKFIILRRYAKFVDSLQDSSANQGFFA